jgi:stearoyl-CoA desaturase (delta-9 desaturase)
LLDLSVIALRKINVWNSSLASLASEVAALYALYLVVSGTVTPAWLLLTFVVYLAIQLSVSVGLHRYYAHRSFECSKFWQYFFAIVGTLSFHGSPIAFVHVHHAHHKYADTDKDSHVAGWQFFFLRRYRVPEGMNSRTLIRLARDPFQLFLLEYSAALCLLLLGILFLISPTLALFGYVTPLGLYFFFTAIHQTTSHTHKGPRDMQWLELLMPICEWRHAYHHKHPTRWDWGTLDMGAYLIRLIKT